MLRIVHVLAWFSAAVAVWIASLRAGLPASQHVAVLCAPLLAVLLFGVYSVGALAHGVLTFRDCPHEAASLQQDIAAAKSDLVKRGVLKPSS